MPKTRTLAPQFRSWSLARPKEIIYANRGQASALFFSSRASGVASWWALSIAFLSFVIGNLIQVIQFFDPASPLLILAGYLSLLALGFSVLFGALLIIVNPLLKRISIVLIKNRTLRRIRADQASSMDFALYLRPFVWDKKPGFFEIFGSMLVRLDATGARSVIERQIILLLSNFADRLPLLSLGRQTTGSEAGRISVSDETWQHDVRALSDQATLIFLVLGPGEGTAWEIEQILDDPALLKKTVFVIPSSQMVPADTDPQASFHRVRPIFDSRRMKLPEWNALGGLFLYDEDRSTPLTYLCDPDPVIAGESPELITRIIENKIDHRALRANHKRKSPRQRLFKLDWTLNPDRFLAVSKGAALLLCLSAALIGAAAAFWIVYFVPDDHHFGRWIRMLFLHAPAAQLAIISAFIITTINAYRLRFSGGRKLLFGQASNAVAYAGAMATLLCLVTGSIWSKPLWGIWILWEDPKTASTILLMISFLGYGLIHRISFYTRPIATFLYGLVPFYVTLLVIMSNEIWFSLHHPSSGGLMWRPVQMTVFLDPSRSSIAPDYLYPLSAAHLAAFLLFSALVVFLMRLQIKGRRRRRLKRLSQQA